MQCPFPANRPDHTSSTAQPLDATGVAAAAPACSGLAAAGTKAHDRRAGRGNPGQRGGRRHSGRRSPPGQSRHRLCRRHQWRGLAHGECHGREAELGAAHRPGEVIIVRRARVRSHRRHASDAGCRNRPLQQHAPGRRRPARRVAHHQRRRHLDDARRRKSAQPPHHRRRGARQHDPGQQQQWWCDRQHGYGRYVEGDLRQPRHGLALGQCLRPGG